MLPKTSSQIVKIALAKIDRTYRINDAKWTKLWKDVDSSTQGKIIKLIKQPREEINIILTWVNIENWTLLTSCNLIEKVDNQIITTSISKIQSTNFGLIKDLKQKIKKFEVSTKTKRIEYVYETNHAGLSMKTCLEIIRNHWINRVIITKDE